MAIDESAEKLFREYETTVLDIHHRSLPLWKYDRSTAIYALLAQHDSHAIIELLAPPISSQSMGVTQKFKSLEEGLSQALRWIHPGVGVHDAIPTSESKCIEDAGSFCKFASDYVNIADMHKMYGRGQVTLSIDENTKKVRFQFLKAGVGPVLGYAEATRRANVSPLAKAPEIATHLFGRLLAKIAKSAFHNESGRIVLDDFDVVNDQDVSQLVNYINPPEEMLLPDDTELVGFTLGDFNSFYLALRRWSFCSSLLFISQAQQGIPLASCLPTQVVSRLEFLSTMESLTSLSRTKVEKITKRLAYDNRTKNPDIFQQPLICGDRSVTWSTRVVEKSRQVRNLLKLMARTSSTKNTAATIIGSRDRAMLNELGSEFARRGGCSYKVITPVAAEEKQGDVDLLVYNWKYGNEVLVIEGKAILGVDEINEVDAATKEMQYAQEQLERTISILKALPNEVKRDLFRFVHWERVSNFWGVVVAQDAEPNDKYEHSIFPGISLATIKIRLRDKHFAAPQRFWDACKERRWLKILEEYEESFTPVRVGDVTYELPTIMEPNPVYEQLQQTKSRSR